MNPHFGMESFLNWWGTHSLQAGVLVMLVVGVQWIFRRQLSARWRFALWWIVLARLLLPFNPQSALSLFNVFKPAVQIERLRPTASRPVQAEQSAQSRGATGLAAGGMAGGGNSAPGSASSAAAKLAAPVRGEAVSSAVIAPGPPALKANESVRDMIVPGLIAGWLGGVMALSMIVWFQVIRFYRRLARTAAPADAMVQTILDDCRHECGVKRSVAVWETEAVQSPALFGLIRLRLLLPRRMGEQFTGRELRYIFLHELAHVKRQDLWLNWLVTALQILHWFNPLLWFGFARLRADRELACDEFALQRTGDAAGTAYGETVIKLLASMNQAGAIPGLVGILEEKKQMRRRITMIANFRKAGRWSVLAILMVAAIAVAALTDAQTNKPGGLPAEVKTHRPAAAPNGDTPFSTNDVKMKVIVRDAKTGAPVAGAEIHAPYFSGLMEANLPRLLTDSEGAAWVRQPKRFHADQMQNFSIEVTASNYATRAVMWISDGGSVLETLPDQYTIRMEKGVTVGGQVRDEHGAPVAGAKVIPWGSDYRGFTMGTGEKSHQEYAEAPRFGWEGVSSDAQGHWHYDNFPADLKTVRVDVVRPGGSRSQFGTEGAEMLTQEAADTMSLPDLLASQLVLTLKDGYTVKGIVVDSAGKPVAGVRLKARGGPGNQTPSFECTNGADGRFEFAHWVLPQFLISAEASAFATKTVVASAGDAKGEKRIVLSPAAPLRVRVVGERDEPVAGASFQVLSWRSGNQLVEWNGLSDTKGVAVWTNAPDAPVTYWIMSSNYPVRAVKLLADGREKVIRLRHDADQRISVALTVADAQSGQPVKEFSVSRTMQGIGEDTEWGEPGRDGKFEGQINASEFQKGIQGSIVLRAHAEGYDVWKSEDIYFDEGDVNLEVKLTKGNEPAGIVRQPDGQPAANARVSLCREDGATVFWNAPDRSYPGRGVATAHAAEDGSVKLESAPADRFVVASHPSGFAVTTVGELRRTRGIQLEPYGSIDGILTENGKPVANESVDVKAPLNWNDLQGFNLVFSVRTDAAGRFVFSNLPASNYVLYRTPHVIMGVQTTESHRWPFELKAGEHKHIDYTFGGREITGHVETAAPVNWQNDAHILWMITQTQPPAEPSYGSYVTVADFQRALESYARSPELLAYEREKQQFQLVFDGDGNFHIDDVPPGNYELRLHVTQPPDDPRHAYASRNIVLGTLNQPVTVPKGDGPLDLGSMAMSVQPAAQPADQSAKPAGPMVLPAQSLDGQPLALSQYKGKYVLLAFWATWSDRCTEQLGELAALDAKFGSTGKFTILGVNLDEDAAAARRATKERGYPWQQAWLDAAGRARAMTNLNLSSLPSFCLVGPDGRVIAHDLTHDRLTQTVQRTLKAE